MNEGIYGKAADCYYYCVEVEEIIPTRVTDEPDELAGL